MKSALKDWITNLSALAIWGLSSYKMFFTESGLDFYVYCGLMALGIMFLFLDAKKILAYIDKFINKKIR